ncbi:hypothetical protein K402DRAFT_110540 [Aulographum hederae CBS 113979]|uniref:Uncharacterized protein n=1 Tax=Aulographum hederae CBS 113979 TaxID=1176131 RepID=A0A6G1GXM0_9PEZI|nr:hypothetical protein K402DRAFT_110540 [Aulographum hederae CBS 113979]
MTETVAEQVGLARKRQRSQKMQRKLSVGVLALYRAEKLIVLMLSEWRDEGGVLASLDSRDVADFGHLRERERSLQQKP